VRHCAGKEKIMSEHMNKVDFSVPLSGSQLFDIHTYATAKMLCDKFPPLNFEYKKDECIRIYGELNDMWYEEWNKAVFNLGRH